MRSTITQTGRDSSWPLILIALPAGVATWSGWVGLGRATGFGQVAPLPGIADHFTIDTAITLPIGVEAYAAYALGAWLSAVPRTTATRRFAAVSAVGSLLLGMLGQVAYHLLETSGQTRAPWPIVTLVSCLPVLVLGMGATLRHMIHRDRLALAEADATGPESGDMAGPVSEVRPRAEGALVWTSGEPELPQADRPTALAAGPLPEPAAEGGRTSDIGPDAELGPVADGEREAGPWLAEVGQAEQDLQGGTVAEPSATGSGHRPDMAVSADGAPDAELCLQDRLAALVAEAPDMSGEELGRLLGVSGRHARRLKGDLLSRLATV